MPRVPILMYHRLGEVRKDSIVPGHYVAPALFERQLKLLKALGMTTVSLKTIKEGFDGELELPKRPVVITFDDGYESFSTLGIPALRRHGMTATVFLVTDQIGGRNEWDLAKGDVDEPLMSREQILQAETAGFEMGAHTCRHVDLPTVRLEQAKEEIERSKTDLETLLDHPVDFFCYPYGGQNEAIRNLVRQAGYLGATSTINRGNGPESDPFQWGRINVRYNYSAFRLLRRLLKARRP